MNYNERLKELREEKNLTQEQLASAINLTRGAYKQYELQYDIIPLIHLNEICNYFDVSLDYIFKFTETKQYSKYSKDFNLKKFSTRIKSLRKAKCGKQEIFASSIDTSQSIISDLENNKKFINTRLLYVICKKYNLSADYLLGKIDEPQFLNS